MYGNQEVSRDRRFFIRKGQPAKQIRFREPRIPFQSIQSRACQGLFFHGGASALLPKRA
jgi:hypothetical protein